MSVLIQGASRGIGLQYTKHLLNSGHLQVVATCRNPDTAENLQ
jgi:short-subunit dehydrogenase